MAYCTVSLCKCYRCDVKRVFLQMTIVGLHMCIMSSVVFVLFKSVSLIDSFSACPINYWDEYIKYSLVITDLAAYPSKSVHFCFTYYKSMLLNQLASTGYRKPLHLPDKMCSRPRHHEAFPFFFYNPVYLTFQKEGISLSYFIPHYAVSPLEHHTEGTLEY